MQRFIEPSIALIWFMQFLDGGSERRMESHAVGLNNFFEERLQQAKHLDEVPPIGADSKEYPISRERATELFQILSHREDLETVQICVAGLRRFLREEMERQRNAPPVPAAAQG